MIRTTRHTPVRAALALLLGVLATVVPVSSASAHSVLIAISPKDGSTVPTAPTRVVLTFNEDVNQQFSLVRVVDASGADVTDGPTSVTGAVVSQPLRAGLPPGTYTVTFKVVSADGHPISQKSTFTVAGPTPTVTPTASPSAPPPSPTPTASPLAQASPSAAGEGTSAPSSSSSSGSSVWLWGLGGLVVLAAAAAGAWALRRRGRAR